MAPPNNVLFSSDLWLRALESYARDTHLSVKLFDADLRIVLGPIHPTPFFQLFEEVGYDPGMFAECARRCLEQTDSRPAVMVSEFYGLAVVGTSLVLDGKVVGAAVAGYAFVDFSQVSEMQRLARDAGIRAGIQFERLWQIAREQKPVPRQRLMLNGELLQVLGDALLRENLRTRQYEETVLKLQETARAKEEVHRELQRAALVNARFAAIVGSSDDAIVSQDLNGVITSWNRGAERLFGYTPEEVVGRPVTILMPPDRVDEEPGILKRIRAGESIEHYETVRRRKDGTLLDISLTVSPIVDAHGKVVGASKIARDITERKQAEESLRESQADLERELASTKLLQQVSTRLIQADDIEVLYQQILDTAAALMRSAYASIQMLHPERGTGGELHLLAYRGFNPEAAKSWEWVSPGSETTCGVAMRTAQRVIVPDVEKCDFMAGSNDLGTYLQTGIHAVQSTPLLSRSGRILGMISTHWRQPHQASERDLRLFDVLARQAADLIERKQAEIALVQSEKLAAAGRMAAAVAHEINNPLEAVTNLLYLLRSEMTSEAGSRNLAMAEEELGRVAQITKKTLAFYRDPSSPATVSVSEVIDSALSVLSGKIAEKQILVVRADQPSTIRGLKGELEQLFSNLIANAIDAVSVGGQIEISVHANGEGVVMAVQDNGAGIRQEHLQKLFEPFFSTKQQYKGTGLGLWVANEVARKHGAQIAVKSSTDVSTHGTTFEVTFPTADGQTSLPAAS
jgi:PAS domain S-box-containing protein